MLHLDSKTQQFHDIFQIETEKLCLFTGKFTINFGRNTSG